jgi:pyridoxamine 5'-phosphate oxidase
MEPSMQAPPLSLPEVLDQAWALLERGARDRRGAAHTPTLATVDAQGRPEARVVVLRRCTPAARDLLIHTDVRSAKIEQLGARDACALLVYDAALKTQLRVAAHATCHRSDALADRQWAESRPMSRVCYGSPLAPGAVVDDPRAAVATLENRAEAEQRAHFAVLRLQVTRIEWLYLHAGGHRRASFEWHDDASTPRMDWLMP